MLGTEHSEVAASLNDLAGLYQVQGAYAQAQPLNALAAAYAEVGKFDLAAATEQKALEIVRANNQANLVPMTETLLKLYQSGKPYREGNE